MSVNEGDARKDRRDILYRYFPIADDLAVEERHYLAKNVVHACFAARVYNLRSRVQDTSGSPDSGGSVRQCIRS
jgi:hypothetical protein